jgi:hypothetical protein
MKEYKILPALKEDALEAWVWMNDSQIPQNIYLIIKNKQYRKSIKTFKRTIDLNYQNNYNARENTYKIDIQSSHNYIVMNEYYREKLGVNKNCNEYLLIKKANLFQVLFKIPLLHPNPVVQYANRSTIVALIIGIIALILTIYSIVKL